MEDNKPLLQDDDGENERQVKTVDQVLAETGTFGRYQFMLLVLHMVILRNGFVSQSLITYYTADDPPWECTHQNVSTFCNQGPFQSGSKLFTKRCHLQSDQWKYTVPKFYSLTTEFDLVCSRQYLKALSTSLFFVGCMVGSLVSGVLADRFGRKPVTMLTYAVVFFGSFPGYFINEVWQYLLLRVIIGLGYGTLAPITFMFFLENVTPKARGWSGNIYFFSFTSAMLVMTCLAYFIRSWRKLVLYSSIFPFVSFFLCIPILESPYWLYSKRKYEKAENVLRKISTFNKKKSSIKLKEDFDEVVQNREYSYFHLFNNRKVLLITSSFSYLWFALGVIFYALALESSNLGGNLYTNFILSSLADAPGFFITIFTSVYIKRKKVGFSSLFICIILLLVIGLTPGKYEKARIALAVLSRMFSTISFNTISLWTFEVYPTVVRSQGINFSEFFGRFGACLAPFLTSVLQDADPSLPFFIMSGFSLIGALAVLLLPEMLGKPTRVNYEEILGQDVVVHDIPPINIAAADDPSAK